MSNQREVHLKAVIRVFANQKERPMAFIIMDTSYESIDSEMISTEHKNISDQGWSQFYTDMEETLLINMPLPQGQAVKIDMFCYATHATDSITRRSITVTIFIIFGTPIIW